MHNSHTLRNPKRTAEDVAIHIAQAIASALPRTPMMGKVSITMPEPKGKPKRFVEGGLADSGTDGQGPSRIHIPEDSPVKPVVHRMRQADLESMMAGVNTKVGDVSLTGGMNQTELNRPNQPSIINRQLFGEAGVPVGNANLIGRISKAPESDVMQGSLMGRMPVGEGNLNVGVHGFRANGQNQVGAYSAGYDRPMGGGRFSVNASHNPMNKSNQVMANYHMPFKDGGSAHPADGLKALHEQMHNPQYESTDHAWDSLKALHVKHFDQGGGAYTDPMGAVVGSDEPSSGEGLIPKLENYVSSLRKQLSGKTLKHHNAEDSEPSIRAIPQSDFERITGNIGKGAESLGRTLAEPLDELEKTHPIRSKLAKMMITDPLTSAGTALQDYTGTARDITPDQPYSRLLSNTSQLTMNPNTWGGFLQTAKLDPRVLDVAAVGQPLAGAGKKIAGKAGMELARMADQAMIEGTGPLAEGFLGSLTPKPMFAVAPGKKMQRANAPKNVADTFEGVTDPVEALKIAQAGKHLKIDPKTGKYIGLGTHIDSPQALGALRKRVDELVDEGAYNADWYLRQKQLAQDLTDNPLEQSLFARGTAAYSPQAMPKVELPTFARQHNERMLTGEDVVPRTGAQSRNVAKAYLPEGSVQVSFAPERIKLGSKTGPYANKKDPTVPVDYKTANDIWHARAFELGDQQGTFNRGLTPQEHGALHGENLLLADRANKAGIPVGSTEGALHDASTAQAATWAGTRYRSLLEDETKRFATESARRAEYEKNPTAWKAKNPNKKSPPPKPRPIMSDEEIRAYASQGLDTAMPAQSAYITKEAVTGEGLGHLPGMPAMTDAEKLAYTEDMMQQIGRDPTIEALGMFSKKPSRTSGEYKNAQGDVEKNPGFQNQVLVSNEKSKTGRVTPESEREALDLAARLDAIMGAQQAGAWSRFHPAGTPGLRVADMDSLVVNTKGLSPAERSKIFEFTQQNQLGAIDHGDRIIIKDFDNDRSATELAKLYGKSNVNQPFQRGRLESGYEPGLMRFGEKGLEPTEPGSGEVTRALLAKMDESKIKDLYERLDMSRWRTVAEGKNNLDRAIAQSKGLPLRDDLLKLRTIIAESGFTGLKDYVKKYGAAAAGLAAFPSIGLPAVLPTERPAQGSR